MNPSISRFRHVDRFKVFFLLLVTALAILPFVYESRTLVIMLTQIFIFAIFAMSYDLLLGYSGIVSFGHAMFFGIGAYTVGLCFKAFGATIPTLFIATLITILFTAIVSYVVGLLTLRLRGHFFAMLTLAVSSLFVVLAEKWRTLTMGNDGFTFTVPEFFRDRTVLYISALLIMVLVYFGLRRFTESPMGRVLQAVRENESRVESLGYKIMHYKLTANVIAGVIAGFAGILYGISLRFVNTAVLSVQLTLDALMITIIGGVGTLFGSIVGAGLIEVAKHTLMDLAKVHWIFERWIILFGTIFILAVMFFPKGIVGTTSSWWQKRKQKKQQRNLEHSEQNEHRDAS